MYFDKLTVKVKLGKNGKIPERKTVGSAGFDLYCSEDVIWENRDSFYITTAKTDVFFEIPFGYEGQIRLRSSMSKLLVSMPHGVGTVDSDYRDEIYFPLICFSKFVPLINKGDRVAQIVFKQVPITKLHLVQELSKSTRDGGFGSTGR